LWAAHLSSRSEEEQEPGGIRIGVTAAEQRPEGDCGHAECLNRGIRTLSLSAGWERTQIDTPAPAQDDQRS
jgi:hypothetical protein